MNAGRCPARPHKGPSQSRWLYINPGINGRRSEEGEESSRMSAEEEEGWSTEIKAEEFLHHKGREAEDEPSGCDVSSRFVRIET